MTNKNIEYCLIKVDSFKEGEIYQSSKEIVEGFNFLRDLTRKVIEYLTIRNLR